MTKLNRKTAKDRNEREYERTLAEKDALIKKLREDNDMLSSITHRDNKLLPALSDAVIRFINSGAGEIGEGEHLLKQIKQHLLERNSIITHMLSRSIIPLTLTNPGINCILNHMMTIASEKGVQFDIIKTNDAVLLSESILPVIKMQTILADLIENAINATSCCKDKYVRVSFGFEKNIYIFRVQDSGIPFKAKTLLSLGETRTTTRKKEGGSGIGYMTVFKLLREYNASLVINEYGPNLTYFTKSVTVRFDNRAEFLLRTPGAERLSEISRVKENESILPGTNIEYYKVRLQRY